MEGELHGLTSTASMLPVMLCGWGLQQDTVQNRANFFDQARNYIKLADGVRHARLTLISLSRISFSIP